jgi:hypothetical protein
VRQGQAVDGGIHAVVAVQVGRTPRGQYSHVAVRSGAYLARVVRLWLLGGSKRYSGPKPPFR